MLHMVAVTYESAGEILKVDLLKKATAHYFEVALFITLRWRCLLGCVRWFFWIFYSLDKFPKFVHSKAGCMVMENIQRNSALRTPVYNGQFRLSRRKLIYFFLKLVITKGYGVGAVLCVSFTWQTVKTPDQKIIRYSGFVKKKPGFKFNLGLALTGVRTTGPWLIRTSG